MNVRVGGLELGGTKTVVAIGTADGAVMEEFRYATTNPEETLTIAADWWRQRGPLVKIGIAAFGPIRLQGHACDFGTLLRTPKTAWQGFSLANFFRERFPESLLCIDTDVNAALLGELQCGAARGMRNVIYVTVGTGIGAGIFCEGNLVYGTLHPEFVTCVCRDIAMILLSEHARFIGTVSKVWQAVPPWNNVGAWRAICCRCITPHGKWRPGIWRRGFIPPAHC